MKNFGSTILKVGLVMCLLALPGASFATTIAGNIGGVAPGYDTANANVVGNDFAGDNLGQAVSFTAGSSSKVGSISLALSCVVCGGDSLTIALTSDASGLPGATIETYTYSDSALGNLGSSNPLAVLSSASNPLLTMGTQYWITVVDSAALDTVGWNLNQTGDLSSAESADGGGTWFSTGGAGGTPAGAYQVDSLASTRVPEPASITLLGSALLLGLGKLRRQKK